MLFAGSRQPTALRTQIELPHFAKLRAGNPAQAPIRPVVPQEEHLVLVVDDGPVVTCGATAGREGTLNLWPLFVKQQRLVGSYGRNRKDLVATLRAVAEGWLRPVIDRVVSLADMPEAFSALHSRSILGKAVMRAV